MSSINIGSFALYWHTVRWSIQLFSWPVTFHPSHPKLQHCQVLNCAVQSIMKYIYEYHCIEMLGAFLRWEWPFVEINLVPLVHDTESVTEFAKWFSYISIYIQNGAHVIHWYAQNFNYHKAIPLDRFTLCSYNCNFNCYIAKMDAIVF